jgi:hypothetical protein
MACCFDDFYSEEYLTPIITICIKIKLLNSLLRLNAKDSRKNMELFGALANIAGV